MGDDDQTIKPKRQRRLSIIESKLPTENLLEDKHIKNITKKLQLKEEKDLEKLSSESSFHSSENKKEYIDFGKLPENLIHALQMNNEKHKHSEFYYKLNSLNHKISIYQELFNKKQPKYIQLTTKHSNKDIRIETDGDEEEEQTNIKQDFDINKHGKQLK